MRHWILFTLCACAAATAHATDYTLTPVRQPDGSVVFGTVSTDGSLGALSPQQITGWQITVRQQQRWLYTPETAPGVQASGVGVSADGQRMAVAASRNGYDDGGLLAFGAFGPWREYGVQVANFTGYYAADGGASFYLAGAAFDWQWFNAVPGSKRLVARAAPGSRVYRLEPVIYPGGAVLRGTLTTDGRTGAIGPEAITDYRLQVTQTADTVYDPSNSALLPDTGGLSADGAQLWVSRPGGYFGVGVVARPPARGRGAVPADFTAAAAKGGQAGYYDAFSYQFKPLRWREPLYPLATATP